MSQELYTLRKEKQETHRQMDRFEKDIIHWKEQKESTVGEIDSLINDLKEARTREQRMKSEMEKAIASKEEYKTIIKQIEIQLKEETFKCNKLNREKNQMEKNYSDNHTFQQEFLE